MRIATAGPRPHLLRPAEWLIFLFLAYAAALATILPLPDSSQRGILFWNCAAACAYAGLVLLDYRRPSPALSITRDWLPLGFILYAYREMGLFLLPDPTHSLEHTWVAWDRVLLGSGLRAGIESLGPVLPALLEIAYAAVYLLPPLALAVLYFAGHRERAAEYDFLVLASVLLTYAQFPFWPSQPPRLLFPGQDFPAYSSVFRHFNLWLLGNYGIHSSVFPSGHVAAAFAAAFGLWRALPHRKLAIGIFFTAATLIAVATIYGRYHYAADAAAGLAMAILGTALAWAFSTLPARLPHLIPARVPLKFHRA